MSDETIGFDFDDELAPASKTVRMKGVRYLLVEASEDAVIRFKNSIAKAVTVVNGKVSNVAPHHEIESALVADCVLKLDPKTQEPMVSSSGKLVTVEISTVRTWGHRFIEEMAGWVKEVSKLTPKKVAGSKEEKDTEEEREKNESSAGTTTSDSPGSPDGSSTS